MADAADIKVTLKLSQLVIVVGSLAGSVATATAGYLSLKNEIENAKYEAVTLSTRVARIECLMHQQTQFQIYGIRPSKSCD